MSSLRACKRPLILLTRTRLEAENGAERGIAGARYEALATAVRLDTTLTPKLAENGENDGLQLAVSGVALRV